MQIKITSNSILLIILVTFMISGIIDGIYDEADDFLGTSYYLHAFLVVVLAFAWCKKHQQERGIKVSNIYPVLVGIIAIIGVPVYFYRTLRFKTASLSTLKAIGYFIITGIVYFIPYTIFSEIST